MSSERYSRLAKEGSWVVAGQVASVLGMLVLVRVLTEYLNPAQYGQLSLGLTVGALVTQVAFSGMMPGIMRYYTIAAEKQELSEFFSASRRLMLYGTLGVVSLGLILMVGALLTEYSHWIGLCTAAVVFYLLANYNTTISSIQNAARQRTIVAFHSGLEVWLKILLVLCMLFWLGHSTTAVLTGYVFSSLIVLGSQYLFLRRLLPTKAVAPADGALWMRHIWTYSLPFTIFNVFTWMQASADRWALGIFSGTREVGLYAVLFQLGYSPIALAMGVITAFIEPILFQRSGDATELARNADVHRIVWRISLLGLLLVLAGVLLAFGLHQWVFRLFVAAEYRSVSYLLPWIVLAGGFAVVTTMLTVKLQSELNTNALIWPKLISAIAGVAFNFYGAYFWGLQGIVAALVAFSAVQFLLLARVASRSA